MPRCGCQSRGLSTAGTPPCPCTLQQHIPTHPATKTAWVLMSRAYVTLLMHLALRSCHASSACRDLPQPHQRHCQVQRQTVIKACQVAHGCSRRRSSRPCSRTARSCCTARAPSACSCRRAAGRRSCTADRHAAASAGRLHKQEHRLRVSNCLAARCGSGGVTLAP